jgi:hypothetical protein
MKTFSEYIGDSNPLKNSYVDTWHNAQHLAINGKLKEAIELMKVASQEAMDSSPGEAKYYLGTIAWLLGRKDLVSKYIRDPEVVKTGNHTVLQRLLNSTVKDYKTAYNS